MIHLGFRAFRKKLLLFSKISIFGALTNTSSAGMVELADTADLKSAAPQGREGSSPSLGTTLEENVRNKKVA